jgi:hypothetical protein
VDWSSAVGIPGISWKGSATWPTDADFATPGNWENKLTDIKNVGLVKILCNNPW